MFKVKGNKRKAIVTVQKADYDALSLEKLWTGRYFVLPKDSLPHSIKRVGTASKEYRCIIVRLAELRIVNLVLANEN